MLFSKYIYLRFPPCEWGSTYRDMTKNGKVGVSEGPSPLPPFHASAPHVTVMYLLRVRLSLPLAFVTVRDTV